jgi:hypothetical protein
MFKLENNNNFIKRTNKTEFNSIIIPAFLQKPISKQNILYLQQIDKKKSYKWYNTHNQYKKLEELRLKKIMYTNLKTVQLITSVANIIKIKQNIKRFVSKEVKTELDSFYLPEGSIILENNPREPLNLNGISDNNSVIITFTEPYSNSEITNYLYSIDWGKFESFEPIQNKSPLIINNLENGTSYVISLKTENKYGTSESSKPLGVFIGLLGLPNE